MKPHSVSSLLGTFRFSIVLLICVSPAFSGHSANAYDRPNIVVIIGDDWSWPHAGVLGDPVAQTKTFDQIAQEGVLFENAFVSAPSCTPSRFAIATGQHHWRLGQGDRLGGSLAADVPVYADLLNDAGYKTGFARKGASPSKHEFRHSDPFGPKFKDFDEFITSRKKDQPFCFWYGAGEPHRPYDWQASLESDLKIDRIIVPSFFPNVETVREDIGDYYLRVRKLDRLAGKILARLKDEGELENTIVIMTSDNGMPFPRCKATLYDYGTRVPLAIRWGAKVTSGRTVTDFVSLVDLAPTILDAAGVEVPNVMTGVSLIQQLESKKSGRIDSNRQQVLVGREKHVYMRPSRAIRTEKYLYIRNFGPAVWPTGEVKTKKAGSKPKRNDFSKTPWPTEAGAFSFDIDPSPTKQWMLENRTASEYASVMSWSFDTPPVEELYDLKGDPEQLNNVADNPKYAKVRRRLAGRLIDGLRELEDPKFREPEHATYRILGFQVHLNDRLLLENPELTKTMLRLLAGQLKRVVKVVPSSALQKLRAVPIWINPSYEGVRPTAEYHANIGWLRNNNRNPKMAKCVEISNVNKFEFENTRMPFLMLHELSHAYHDQVLGFNNPDIRSVFEAAKESGGYDEVDRFTGRKIIKDKAYAMSNPKEYFAESTEAFFGKNDFFPFNRAELKAHDPKMDELLMTLWGVKHQVNPADR